MVIRKIEDRDALQLLYTDDINSLSFFEQPILRLLPLPIPFHMQQVQDRYGGSRPVFLLICIDTGLIITLWLENQNSYPFISHTLLIRNP
jgi:hypothetical protein